MELVTPATIVGGLEMIRRQELDADLEVWTDGKAEV